MSRGWSKARLLDVAEAYEPIAKITPDNPIGAGRAAQLREIARLFDESGEASMTTQNRFLIHNDMGKLLILNIEPECLFFHLSDGQQVTVSDRYDNVPVTLKISLHETGHSILSIWPGDGEVKVEKDGVDVLDLDPSIQGPLGSQS